MLKKILNKIFGRKKEVYEYPEEFCIINYNDIALRNGIEDFTNKVIIRYKLNERIGKIEVYRVYGFSESLFFNLKNKLKIPIYDKTEKEIKLPVFQEIMLDEVSYIKE